MRKKTERIITTILLMLVLFCISAIAVYGDDGDKSGNYDGVDWHITTDGTLVLGNSAGAQHFAYRESRDKTSYPWDEFRSEITTVAIEGHVYLDGSMSGMFADCTAMESASLSGISGYVIFDNVTDLSDMFSGCFSLKKLTMWEECRESFPKTTGMFRSCSSLESLDLGGMTLGYDDSSEMFDGCTSLSSLTVYVQPLWRVGERVIPYEGYKNVFKGCDSLHGISVYFLPSSDENDPYILPSSIADKPITGVEIQPACKKSILCFRDMPYLRSISIENDWDALGYSFSIKKFIASNCKQLESVYCLRGWGLEELRLNNCPSLKRLDVGFEDSDAEGPSNIRTLVLKKCDNLEYLICNYNELKNLNLSGCPSLKVLDCSDNYLTSLNVTGLRKLQTLHCAGNCLQTLDLTKNKRIKELYCDRNNIQSLKLPSSKKLKVTCKHNLIKSTAALTKKYGKKNVLPQDNPSKSLPKLKVTVTAAKRSAIVEIFPKDYYKKGNYYHMTYYQIQYRKAGTKKWYSVKCLAKRDSSVTKNITKLKKKTKYNIRARVLLKANGKTYKGKWTATKSIKIRY